LKLWQKIFLLTLTLVIILVNTTSLVLLKNNHDLTLVREQQTALTRHSYLSTEILNSVVNAQLAERTVPLADGRMQTLLRDVLNSQSDNLSGASIYQGELLIHTSNDPAYPTGDQGVIDSAAQQAELNLLAAPDFSSTITRLDNQVYLMLVSRPTFNEQTYQLITFYNITSTYQLFDASFNQVRIIGVVSALLIGGILLLLVLTLLRPLRSLSTATRQIASGDLQKRVKVRGNDEVADLARNLNSMADSIEANVQELEQLAESRKTFIGNLAHEMKTPLTSILGYADLLRVQRQVSDSSRTEYANVIVNETKRLQTLSGKLMELLSVGNMKLSLEPIDLFELANQLTVTLQPIFIARKMSLVCQIPMYNCVVLADRELLQSLILNLIDNAIKASTEGATITIAARELLRERKDAPSAHLERRIAVGVIDDGMGIPADQIPQLTEPFFMLDKARTRRHGGAGLGLALCAEIARAHGSELYIESEIGVGTTVSCDFAAAYGHTKEVVGLPTDPASRTVIAGDEFASYIVLDDAIWHPSRGTAIAEAEAGAAEGSEADEAGAAEGDNRDGKAVEPEPEMADAVEPGATATATEAPATDPSLAADSTPDASNQNIGAS